MDKYIPYLMFSLIACLLSCGRPALKQYSQVDANADCQVLQQLGLQATVDWGVRYGYFCNVRIADLSVVDRIPRTKLPVDLSIYDCHVSRSALTKILDRWQILNLNFSNCKLESNAVSLSVGLAEELIFDNCDCEDIVPVEQHEPRNQLRMVNCGPGFATKMHSYFGRYANVELVFSDAIPISFGRLDVTQNLDIRNANVEFERAFSANDISVLSLNECTVSLESLANAAQAKSIQVIQLMKCLLPPKDLESGSQQLIITNVGSVEVVGSEKLGEVLKRLLPLTTHVTVVQE